MATYYPEGECFFLRSSLKYPSGWSAEDPSKFYSHVLIEYYWNSWVTVNTQPKDYTHTRSKLVTGKGAYYGTLFGVWDRFYVGESVGRDVGNMLAISSHPNSENFNECRDRDQGGPLKYILRPVEITNKSTEWLWVDGTVPIRAIYFPVCQKSDEAFQNYCTYVVIDFRGRQRVDITNLNGKFQTYSSSPEAGLGYVREMTWGFNIPNIITYLTLPRQVREPTQGLYRTAKPGDELFVRVESSRTWYCRKGINHTQGFYRDIDLARVVSATFGIDVGWRPYEFSTFILDLVKQAADLGLGFVPGVGPLMSVGFGIALQVIQDPESFKRHNVLELGAAVLEIVITSALKSRKYTAPHILPKINVRTMDLTDQAENQTDERKARKEAGEALNARLTEIVRQLHGQDFPQSQAWLDRIADGARTASADPVRHANAVPAGGQDSHRLLDTVRNAEEGAGPP